MKKVLVSIALAAFACISVSCQKETPIASANTSAEEGIVVTIKSGAPFQTKSDGDFVTVTCEDDENVVTLVSETNELSDNIVESKNYTEDGELIATLLLSGNEIIDVELSEYLDQLEAAGASERFRDCVKRVYKDLKDNLEDHCQILSDMGISASIGSLVAEASAIVKCM